GSGRRLRLAVNDSRQRLPGYGEAVAARQDVAGTALQARPAGHRCPAAPTGVRLPPGGGKGTPERPARPPRTNWRSFTAGEPKRNAGTASPAPPHQLAFVYRQGAEKERRNGQPGPPRTNWRSFTAGGRKRNAGWIGRRARCGIVARDSATHLVAARTGFSRW